MTEFYGSYLIIKDSVKYVGDGFDPAKCPYMKAFIKALKQWNKDVTLHSPKAPKTP